MAKGQKRSNREAKKPKTAKKKHNTPAYLLADAPAAQKSVLETSSSKH